MAGEGSIYKRADGKYVAQLSFGTRTDRRYRRRIRSSRRDAHDALRDLQREQDEWSQPATQSLGNYLRWWLDETVGDKVTPNTIRGYRAAIDHFEPVAHITLADLRAEHIEAVCNRMRATRYVGPKRPPVDIGPASPKTVRNAQLMLRAALESAHAGRGGHRARARGGAPMSSPTTEALEKARQRLLRMEPRPPKVRSGWFYDGFQEAKKLAIAALAAEIKAAERGP